MRLVGIVQVRRVIPDLQAAETVNPLGLIHLMEKFF
jgi:hypothetical protein